jgi:hypothetical protein
LGGDSQTIARSIPFTFRLCSTKAAGRAPFSGFLRQRQFSRHTRKSFFERRNRVFEIVSAGCQRPSERRILNLRLVGHAGVFLFSDDIAIDDLEDTGD